jgi:hypothetical protein
MKLDSLKKSKIYIFGFLLFLFGNLNVISGYGLYVDDWTLLNQSTSIISQHNRELWGIFLYDYRFLAFLYHIFINYFTKEINYLFSIFLSIVIFFQLFFLINILINQNFKIKDKKISHEILFLLILSWYFFSFNIGGQFWLTIIGNTKFSTIFFLLSIIFLIRRKLFFSLIFLTLAFDVYEIYYFSYLSIVLIYYFSNLFDKKIFKYYFLYSLLIQFFFILIKNRESINLNILQIVYEFIRNIGAFFYSFYSVFFSGFAFDKKIFIFFFFFISLFLYLVKKYFLIRNKKFIIIALLLIVISFLFNSLVLTLGNYHYWGKGIFSRTMFQPSLLILFFLSIFLISDPTKKDLYVSFFIFLFSFTFFLIESNNWKKSSSLQKKIINSYELQDKKSFLEEGNNLVLFLGPCYYEGVDVFVSSWDLNKAVKNYFQSFEKNDFVPLANFQIYYDNLDKKMIIHKTEYLISNYQNVYVWNFYNYNIFRLEKHENIESFSLNNRKSCFVGEDLYFKAKTIEKKITSLILTKN